MGSSPPWHASWVTAGCEAQGYKPKLLLFHPVVAGEEKAGRVNVCESLHAS
jgi:hypothetical protein